MRPQPARLRAPWWALSLALGAALSVATMSSAQAEPRKQTGLLSPTGTTPGELADGPKREWHRDCTHRRRRPMSLVLVYDDHRDYRPAHLGEAKRTKELLDTVCPGDRVAIFAVSRELRPLGEALQVKDLADLDDLLLRVEKRREPRDYRRINDHVIKAAELEWGDPDNRAKPDLLRVLVYFTRDLESKAPVPSYVRDFSWASPPYWLQGEALVALFKPIASLTEVKAWETFLIATPEFVAPDAIDQGLRVELDKWLTPARIKPKPVRKLAKKRATAQRPATIVVAAGVPQPDLPELWPTPDGVLLWDHSWTPWVAVAAMAMLLLLVLVWALSRAAPRGPKVLPAAEARDMTLILHDRIHGSVVNQERARLDAALRVGASVTNDVIVPGPYALEIVPGAAGSSPRLRSTNALVVEVQRAGGGRTLRATDSVPVPLRSGDRVHLGGGHDLEVRYI